MTATETALRLMQRYMLANIMKLMGMACHTLDK